MIRSVLESAQVVLGVVMSLVAGAAMNAVLAWQLDPELLYERDTWTCILVFAPFTALPLLTLLPFAEFMVGLIAYMTDLTWRYLAVPSVKLAPYVAAGFALYIAAGFALGFFVVDILRVKPVDLLAIGSIVCLVSWLIHTHRLALIGGGVCLVPLISTLFSLGV